MKKVFLHLGAHKTATTFIQQNLDASRAAFEAQGWTVVHFHDEQPKIHKAFRAMRANKRLKPAVRVELEGYFGRLKASPSNIMFTCEGMLGSARNFRPAGLYPQRAEAAKLLRSFFAGCEVTVGFALRDFADFLESAYLYLVGMEGHTGDFEDFIGKLEPDNITWLGLVEDLCKVFGEQNVRLWTYEDFRKDSTASYLKVMQSAGLDLSKLNIPIPQPVNVSISAETVPAQLLWNRTLGRGKESSQRTRHQKAQEMSMVLAQLPLANRGRLMSSDLRAVFDAKYAEELKTIHERWPALMLSLP